MTESIVKRLAALLLWAFMPKSLGGSGSPWKALRERRRKPKRKRKTKGGN